MEHDPLRNGNDAILRLGERCELRFNGIVGVCHGAMLWVLAVSFRDSVDVTTMKWQLSMLASTCAALHSTVVSPCTLR